MGKKKLTEKFEEVTTPEAVNVAEVPAQDAPAESGKRGRGRPKNAERQTIEAQCEDDNTLTLTLGGTRVRYTPAGMLPFIPSASIITAEDARTMANILSRLPAGNVDREVFVTGIRAVGNLTLDALVTVVNWHKRNAA